MSDKLDQLAGEFSLEANFIPSGVQRWCSGSFAMNFSWQKLDRGLVSRCRRSKKRRVSAAKFERYRGRG